MAMQGGLTNETFVEAHSIVKINKQEDEEVDDEEMSQEELKALAQVGLPTVLPELYKTQMCVVFNQS